MFYVTKLMRNRIVWDSKVKEIILSTNSGQIDILPNHVPIATAVDIGILRILLIDQWLTMACIPLKTKKMFMPCTITCYLSVVVWFIEWYDLFIYLFLYQIEILF